MNHLGRSNFLKKLFIKNESKNNKESTTAQANSASIFICTKLDEEPGIDILKLNLPRTIVIEEDAHKRILEELSKTPTYRTSTTSGKYIINLEITENNTTKTINKTYKKNASSNISYNKRTTITSDNNGTILVTYESKYFDKGEKKIQNARFEYRIEDLENYIIHESKTGKNVRITYFQEIPNIRALPEEQRTEAQKNLLNEFDNLIKFITETGIEYGVDPKAIISIIQQEVKFEGLSDKVVGKNGKGYMQITTIAVADILGCTGYKGSIQSAKFAKENKINLYGIEVVELFASRGFDITSAKSEKEKRALTAAIMNYLTQNEDPEFNIKLGTLLLRTHLKRANGNFRNAAYNYNGNPKLQRQYAQDTSKFYTILSKKSLTQTHYQYKTEHLET